MPAELAAVIADHIAAVNAFVTGAIVATFAADAYVNDNCREIVGVDAKRRFMKKEVREVVDHCGNTIVRARYDGIYDKTSLPDELVMSSYFSVREGKIVSLAVSFNQPSPY